MEKKRCKSCGMIFLSDSCSVINYFGYCNQSQCRSVYFKERERKQTPSFTATLLLFEKGSMKTRASPND